MHVEKDDLVFPGQLKLLRMLQLVVENDKIIMSFDIYVMNIVFYNLVCVVR